MLLILSLALHSLSASAQWQRANWLHLDGAFVQRDQREDGGAHAVATRAGGRGELGLNLLRFVAVSAGGAYQDGGGSVDDAKVSHFAGYASETRALAHLIYAPLVLSTGLAQAESFDTFRSVYRARTSFDYKPLMLTLNWGPAYLRLEQSLGAKGSVARSYGDQGGGRTSVKFAVPKIRGQAFELGLFLPGPKYQTHIFLNYARWTFDASDAVSNGVEDVRAARAETKVLSAGLGLAF